MENSSLKDLALWIGVFFTCIASIICNCQYESQTYLEENVWSTSSCNICSCRSNNVNCTKIICPNIPCGIEEDPHHSSNNCCPGCIPAFKKSCINEDSIHLHNDVWMSDIDCIIYQCRDGVEITFISQCPSLVCPWGEELQMLPGECCPKCLASVCNSREIENQNRTNKNDQCFVPYIHQPNDCNKKVSLKKSTAAYQKDPCTLCIGKTDEIRCFIESCPPCEAEDKNNNTCCPCYKSSCSKECSVCLPGKPEYCTECNDPQDVLQDGTCSVTCRERSFMNESNYCEDCHLSCETCFGRMNSQCLSCKDGFLLEEGHCVESCSPHFFSENAHCIECHESCASCQDENEYGCLSCTLADQLIQDGRCVDDCDGHFYISEGYCLPCNDTCVRCLKNGTCQYCEDTLYLEEGYCIPDCSPGYYMFLDAYCLPCHLECQGCFGPLPFQCISCPFGQFLLENSCVWDCGQGYFGDLGAGICRPCHPSCRSCFGGLAEYQCLTCSKGYLMPHIGTQFGSCVEKCPPQFFLLDSGFCLACHDSCETCFGPNDTDCTSCNNSLHLKNGRCVPHCSAGYFNDDGICYACHPSCAACHGFNDDQCYTCPPGRSFQHGRCVSSCAEGEFMDLTSSCNSCHPSCADCMLNSTESEDLHCLHCRNKQQHVLFGECVSGCPPNFLLNFHHVCQECHSTCATCETSRGTGCASCWEGNYLTHLGTCESQCPQGYYPENNICQACDSNCHHCASTGMCLRCKGDHVLQFGRCVSECSEQHYIDAVTRECKECSWDCNTCRGPSSTDCTSCILGKFLQDGICVRQCSLGFYQNVDICESCDLKCRTCSSLRRCTTCEIPLLLLNGECVDQCGSGYFADIESAECKACGLNCAYCDSPEICVLCKDGSYLHHMKCVTDCPEQYVGDSVWRFCKSNIAVPHLSLNNVLTINAGGSILISSSFLNISDEDSDMLYVFVVEVPKNGLLYKMSKTGKYIYLKTGESFISKHLKDGWIFFKHLKGASLDGQLLLKVSDGQLQSDLINLPIQIVSPFPPSIYQSRQIVISEISSVKLDSKVLFLHDKDNIEDVMVRIVKKPCFGKLILPPRGEELTNVSSKIFSKNGIIYKHLGPSTSKEDMFILQASDGFNSKLTELKIYILPKDNNTPLVVVNKPLIAEIGSMTRLTNKHLLAISKVAKPSDIVFNIERSSVVPTGWFFKSASDGNQNAATVKAVSFTQDDINRQLVLYNHISDIISNITVNLKVFDVNERAVKSNVEFEINIIKSKTEANFLLPANEFGMMVLQNHPTVISSDDLSVRIKGYSADHIVYVIIKDPEEGILENKRRPSQKLKSFTQQDVDDLDVVYHPSSDADAVEKQFFFQFIVVNAATGSQLSPVQIFTITVHPIMGFTSHVSYIDHEVTLSVSQGQSVLFGDNVLSTVGHEIPEDQLEVVLTEAPQHGDLIQSSTGVEVLKDDGLSFSSIINDIEYVHDGSDKLRDSALFTITSGRHSSLNRVNFEVAPVDNDSPVILDSTMLMGSVTQGSFLNLQRQHLAYTDLISGDSDIVFTLLHLPKYGKLEKKNGNYYQVLKAKDTFTQQDINDLKIRFSANSDIDNDTVSDFIYLDVSDANGNVQSNQVLAMTVKKRVKLPPVVKITSDVQVEEGGHAVLESHIITVFDPDSPFSDLIVEVEQQPEFGFLENSRPIPGAEKSLDGIPISSFPYIDVLEGFIKYRQGSHSEVEPTKDTVYIRITDGFLSSAPHLINITIKPVNDEAPQVFTGILTVPQGGYSKILNSTLWVVDADTNPNQLLITLDYPPQNGIMKKMRNAKPNFKTAKTLMKQDSFTFQDILDGLVLYFHDNMQTLKNDSFAITVSDGVHSVSSSVDVTIIKKDKEVPVLFINLGLHVKPGNLNVISQNLLKASDLDSPDDFLVYSVTSDPTSGHLYLLEYGEDLKSFLTATSDYRNLERFTQLDINQRRVVYHHAMEDPLGVHYFKFNVNDRSNNTLLDQKFIITISDDDFPPVVTKNTGLLVQENGFGFISSEQLFAIDEHSGASTLEFSLSSGPYLGYLDLVQNEGIHISKFLPSDLTARNVRYVHTSPTKDSLDSFTFRVSDGKNWVLQTFFITIASDDNVLPLVRVSSLNVKEGSQKIISEFEIDILDKDTIDSKIVIKIVAFPNHGTLLNSNSSQVTQFSMEDIRAGRISYQHDDSDTLNDVFTFTVSDQINQKFIFARSDTENITTEKPIVFQIKVLPVDDVSPILSINKKLNKLMMTDGRQWNTITRDILLTKDVDTSSEKIQYTILVQPHLGILQLASIPGKKVTHFTQRDIDGQQLQYILYDDDFVSTEDKFMFSVI